MLSSKCPLKTILVVKALVVLYSMGRRTLYTVPGLNMVSSTQVKGCLSLTLMLLGSAKFTDPTGFGYVLRLIQDHMFTNSHQVSSLSKSSIQTIRSPHSPTLTS